MRRAQIALIAVLLLGFGAAGFAGTPRDVAGIALPPRSRAAAEGTFIAAGGFKKTVVYFERYLSRRGVAYRQVPVVEARGVLVSRFLSEDAASRWAAIHVYRIRGVTSIFVVAAAAASPGGARDADEKPRRP